MPWGWATLEQTDPRMKKERGAHSLQQPCSEAARTPGAPAFRFFRSISPAPSLDLGPGQAPPENSLSAALVTAAPAARPSKTPAAQRLRDPLLKHRTDVSESPSACVGGQAPCREPCWRSGPVSLGASPTQWASASRLGVMSAHSPAGPGLHPGRPCRATFISAFLQLWNGPGPKSGVRREGVRQTSSRLWAPEVMGDAAASTW